MAGAPDPQFQELDGSLLLMSLAVSFQHLSRKTYS
jgi:hypothetical protein